MRALTSALRRGPTLGRIAATDRPPGYIVFRQELATGGSEDDVIAVNPHSYPSVQGLVNELYLAFLTDQVAPFKFGRDWVLEGPGGFFLAPWSWLVHGTMGPAHLERDAWAPRTPAECGMFSQTVWRVVRPDWSALFGLALNDHRLLYLAQHGSAKQRPIVRELELTGFLENVPIEQIDPGAYRMMAVFNRRLFDLEEGDCGPSASRRSAAAFSQTTKPIVSGEWVGSMSAWILGVHGVPTASRDETM